MKIWAGIFLSSVLFILSFPFAYHSQNLIPPYISYIVVWFYLVPMLLSIRGLSKEKKFLFGYVFGLLSNGGVFFWIIIAMQKYGNLGFFTSFSILLSLIFYLALYPAFTFWMIHRLRGMAPSWLLGAIFFTFLEWSRTYFPLEGFPWGAPAYALFGANTLIQSADIVGVSGLNFLIFLVNFLAAEMMIAKLGKRHLRYGAIFTGFCLVLTFAYGIMRKGEISRLVEEADHISVALLQPNIPQEIKRSSQKSRQILYVYQDLLRSLSEENLDLIVWPEASLPYTIRRDSSGIVAIRDFSPETPMIVGAPTWDYLRKDPNENKTVYYNSAFLVSDRGIIRHRYDKQHLVPFGEYVPLSDFAIVTRIVPSVAGNFQKGPSYPSLFQLSDITFGTLICYEVLFPDLALDYAKRGAGLIVNITNDAWFDETSGPYQHLNFGAFRAIETRRSIVRSANTGISGWYDPLGNLHDRASYNSKAIIRAEVPILSEKTFYAEHPHWVIHGITACMILILFGVLRQDDETSL